CIDCSGCKAINDLLRRARRCEQCVPRRTFDVVTALLEGWYIRILRRAFGSGGREHVHLSRTCQLAEVGDSKDGRCYFAGDQGLQRWRGTFVRYVREFDASRFGKQQTKKVRQPPRSRRGEVAVFTTGLGDRHILGQGLGWHSRSRPK